MTLRNIIDSLLNEEEEKTKLRRTEFNKTILDNYHNTFIKPIEKIVNKMFCNNKITKIKLESALNNLTDIKLFNGKKEIKDDELKEKIFSFYKLKKKALDSNSDYYFKNKPEKNQKVALLRRSIGEELE